eukprot:gene4288-4575_t
MKISFDESEALKVNDVMGEKSTTTRSHGYGANMSIGQGDKDGVPILDDIALFKGGLSIKAENSSTKSNTTYATTAALTLPPNPYGWEHSRQDLHDTSTHHK